MRQRAHVIRFTMSDVMKTHISLSFCLFTFKAERILCHLDYFHTALVHGIRIFYLHQSEVSMAQTLSLYLCAFQCFSSNLNHLHAIKPSFEFNDDISDQEEII